MLMIANKKASILLILKVLQEYSDEEHFLTQQDIIEKVSEIYGIELERKSVAFSISLLQELEYDINKSPRGGYALLARDFDNSEIRFIVDALFSSKSISGKQAATLSNKLNSCLSRYQRRDYKYIYKSEDISRTDNKEVFYTLELIEEAKRRGKRVSFQYQSFDKEGKTVLRKDGFRYIVSPYYSVNSNGRYYLICNYREKYRPITWFRIDFMTNPKIEEEWPIKPLQSLEGMGGFSISKYLNENIYLLDGEVINATIEIENPEHVVFVKDWFGENAKLYSKDDKLYADIRSNESALFYWYMQYSETLRIVSPQSLIDRVKAEAERILKKHEKEPI
ncbi:MAG: WYL domain-containing protein [Bacilli bacterium]|nr:WYL domain-containing protein [Bacilli bacterium]